MPRVSRSHLHEKRLREIQEHFSYLISSLNDGNDIKAFFDEFFTKEEKIMLAKRLVLYMMLKKEYSPSTIQAALHISYETVRSHANQIPGKNARFHAVIDKLITREKTKEFFERINKILKPVELALRAKTDMKARAKLASGNWS